jgi:hypothetical protein
VVGEVGDAEEGRVMVWMAGGQRLLEGSRPPKMKALLLLVVVVAVLLERTVRV